MLNVKNRQDEIEESRYLTTTLFRVLVKIIAVIWLFEGFIMFVFSFFPKMPPLLEGIIDATSLSIFSAIPIWFWIVRPLKLFADKYLAHLESLEKAISTSAIVAVTDTKGKIIHVNDKFVEITRYSREELLGKDHRVINSGYHPKEFFSVMWKTILNGDSWRGEVKNKRKDGSYYWPHSPQKRVSLIFAIIYGR